MNVDSVGAQEFLAQPKALIMAPDEPLLIKLRGSLQSRSEVKCSMRVNSLQCEFYYLPYSDNVVVYNKSQNPIKLMSRSPDSCRLEVSRLGATSIQPVQWRFSCGEDAVELQLMPRRYVLQLQEGPTPGTAKRQSENDASSAPSKKMKAPVGAVTKPPPLLSEPNLQSSSVLPKPVGSVWAGTNLDVGHTVTVMDAVTGLPEYSLRRLSSWSHRSSVGEAFEAVLDDGKSKPQAVLAKSLGYRLPLKSDKEEYIPAKRAAHAWLQEFTAHWRLQHVSAIDYSGHRTGCWRTLYLHELAGSDCSSSGMGRSYALPLFRIQAIKRPLESVLAREQWAKCWVLQGRYRQCILHPCAHLQRPRIFEQTQDCTQRHQARKHPVQQSRPAGYRSLLSSSSRCGVDRFRTRRAGRLRL